MMTLGKMLAVLTDPSFRESDLVFTNRAGKVSVGRGDDVIGEVDLESGVLTKRMYHPERVEEADCD